MTRNSRNSSSYAAASARHRDLCHGKDFTRETVWTYQCSLNCDYHHDIQVRGSTVHWRQATILLDRLYLWIAPLAFGGQVPISVQERMWTNESL
jgi:hypothetical protein